MTFATKPNTMYLPNVLRGTRRTTTQALQIRMSRKSSRGTWEVSSSERSKHATYSLSSEKQILQAVQGQIGTRRKKAEEMMRKMASGHVIHLCTLYGGLRTSVSRLHHDASSTRAVRVTEVTHEKYVNIETFALLSTARMPSRQRKSNSAHATICILARR